MDAEEQYSKIASIGRRWLIRKYFPSSNCSIRIKLMKLNVPSKIHRSPLWKYRAYTLNTNRQNQTAASRTHIRQHCTFLCVYVLVMRLQPFTEALKAISLYRYIIDIIVRWFEVCCFYICLSVCLSFCVGRSSILIAISILCKMKIVVFVVVAADE